LRAEHLPLVLRTMVELAVVAGIIVLGYAGKVGEQAVTAILGAIAGAGGASAIMAVREQAITKRQEVNGASSTQA
jgi:hypothetical protein